MSEPQSPPIVESSPHSVAKIGVSKINSQVTHTSYPDLWTSLVDNLVDHQGITGGQLVDNWGKPKLHPHRRFARPHSTHNPGGQKRAGNWEDDVLPRIHSPYDYDFLKTK
jgi:hypothetical protein